MFFDVFVFFNKEKIKNNVDLEKRGLRGGKRGVVLMFNYGNFMLI